MRAGGKNWPQVTIAPEARSGNEVKPLNEHHGGNQVDIPEVSVPKTAHQTQASPKQRSSSDHSPDHRSAARVAKKKLRRRAHRAAIRRQHANG